MPKSQEAQENPPTADDCGDRKDATDRGDAILKRMLKTPPKQHKDMKKSKRPKSKGA
jgi:hypothetical protein